MTPGGGIGASVDVIVAELENELVAATTTNIAACSAALHRHSGKVRDALRANVLIGLHENAHDERTRDIFEAYMSYLLAEADEEDVVALEYAIDRAALLPQHEWGLALLDGKADEPALDAFAAISRHMQAVRATLLTRFGRLVAADAATFDEAGYLEQNGDVASAVASGQFASGRQHFDECGHVEMRKMRIYKDQ